MGYRNQAISGDIMPLTDDSVIFGPAFTSIGTGVFDAGGTADGTV